MLLRRFPGVRIGFDYLNVLGGVAKVIDKGALEPPLLFIKDGDLLATIHTMIQQREGTVEVSEVKGHADQAMVDDATVRHEHFVGNDGADTAADLGRSRQQDEGVLLFGPDATRTPSCWLDLHKFLVAISRTGVDHGGYGGTAPDAMIWDNGGILELRSSSLRVCFTARSTWVTGQVVV